MLESRELCWRANIGAGEQRSVLTQRVEGASPVSKILEVATAAPGVVLLRRYVLIIHLVCIDVIIIMYL